MFWTIVITALICALLFLVIALRMRCKEQSKENHRLSERNRVLTQKLEDCRDFEVKRRVNDSYRRGLDVGRETDRAYRELLKRCRGGDIDAKAYEILQQEGGSK